MLNTKIQGRSFSDKIGMLRNVAYTINPNEVAMSQEELVSRLETAQHFISSAAPLGDENNIEGWISAFLYSYKKAVEQNNGSLLYYYRNYAMVLLNHRMNHLYGSTHLGIAA